MWWQPPTWPLEIAQADIVKCIEIKIKYGNIELTVI